MTETPPEVLEPIELALEDQGLVATSLEPVSIFQGNKVGRYAFRAECGNGTTVKVRYLVEDDRAAKLFEIRKGLDPAFGPAISHLGPVLVEEWIVGESWGPKETETRSAEAGALLGRLHNTPPHNTPRSGSAPERKSTEWHRRSAEANIQYIEEHGNLAEDDLANLRSELARLDPGSFVPSIIHRDYCGENFILDPGGRLVVIDNEWFMIGPAGFDIGRTYHRWPMSEAAWSAFQGGHGSAGANAEDLQFWMISATLFGAWAFLLLKSERVEPLDDLLRLLGSGQLPFVTE